MQVTDSVSYTFDNKIIAKKKTEYYHVGLHFSCTKVEAKPTFL